VSAPPEDWREKGFTDAMALSARFNDVLPIVYFDGKYVTAFEAKSRITRSMEKKGGEIAQ
jgi:hypothetical protein